MQMVMIADDITGTFDTGIQFAKRGVHMQVLIGSQVTEKTVIPSGVEVLAIDAETRHMTGKEAYQETWRLASWARKNGAEGAYIKTDSGLRGNIAAAFQAAMDVWQTDYAVFAPAYPAMGRKTVGGVQYIDGVPLHRSVYGADPFNPVSVSDITALFECQGMHAESCTIQTGRMPGIKPAVAVFDASSDEELRQIADSMASQGKLQVCGGCAGFAAVLAERLPVLAREPSRLNERPLFVVCGSISRVSLAQLDQQEERGALRVHLTQQQLLSESYWDTEEANRWLDTLFLRLDEKRNVLVDSCRAELPKETVEQARPQIAKNLGAMILRMIHRGAGSRYTPFIIGGDTLMGFLEQLGVSVITLLDEPLPGVVMFQIEQSGKRVTMLSKSGSFGTGNLIDELLRKVNEA